VKERSLREPGSVGPVDVGPFCVHISTPSVGASAFQYRRVFSTEVALRGSLTDVVTVPKAGAVVSDGTSMEGMESPYSSWHTMSTYSVELAVIFLTPR
jgi:hypothetical protein